MSRQSLEDIYKSLDSTEHLSDAQIDQMTPMGRLLAQIESVSSQSSTKSLKRRFWRRGIVLSTAAVLAIGSAAAAISLSQKPLETVANMTCFQKDSLTSTAEIVPYAASPLADCSQTMHWPKVLKQGERATGILCLLSDGSLAAFPPSQKLKECSDLRLVAFNGHLANPEFARFQLAAESLFVHHPCQTVNLARRETLKLMGTFGLSEWKLRISGSSSMGTCATLAFQLGPKVVDIVGVER
jgi:hypothetical protein